MGTLLLPLNFSCESSTILQGKRYFQKTTVSYITKAKQEKYWCPYQRGTGTHTCPQRSRKPATTTGLLCPQELEEQEGLTPRASKGSAALPTP